MTVNEAIEHSRDALKRDNYVNSRAYNWGLYGRNNLAKMRITVGFMHIIGL